jgi:hypothetical protein
VRPVVYAVRVLGHKVAGDGFVGSLKAVPLFGAWKIYACMAIDPLDEAGTIPAQKLAGAAPDVRRAESGIGCTDQSLLVLQRLGGH